MKNLVLILILTILNLNNSQADEVLEAIKPIQTQWAIIKYQTAEKQQADAYNELMQETKAVVESYPERAEPLIWQAIVTSAYGGAVGGIKSITKALPAVKSARKLLLKAERIDPSALDGSVYVSLGALYYQVPGWPIGFGDKKQARSYLTKAIQMSQNKLNSGYFYGDFLMEQKEYKQAKTVLTDSLSEPELPGRPVADQGLRSDIQKLLEKANGKITPSKSLD